MRPRQLRNLLLAVSPALLVGATQAELPEFSPKPALVTGANVHSTVAADLDSDGDLDLAVARFTSGFNLLIFVNLGDATFQNGVSYASGGDGASSIDAADLDGDTDIDLVVANYSSVNMSTLMNNGNATFPPLATVYPILPTQLGPFSLACSDMNGDLSADVVLAKPGPSFPQGAISVFTNVGGGSMVQTGEYSAGNHHRSIASLDIDGDSDLDVLTADTDSTVSLLVSHGDGSVDSLVSIVVSGAPMHVLGADFDGDGVTDLAVALAGNPGVSILIQHADSGFLAPVHYAASEGLRVLAHSDLDLDGDLDLVAGGGPASDSITLFENNGAGAFQLAARIPFGLYPTSIECARLDGDVDPEIIVASYSTGSVIVLENLLCSARRGDVNASGTITSSDIIFLVNYVFKGGPLPACNGATGDVNCSQAISSADIIQLVNYVFKGGPAPC